MSMLELGHLFFVNYHGLSWHIFDFFGFGAETKLDENCCLQPKIRRLLSLQGLQLLRLGFWAGTPAMASNLSRLNWRQTRPICDDFWEQLWIMTFEVSVPALRKALQQPLFWSLPSFLALASTLQPSLRSRLRLAFQPGTRNPSADGHQLQDVDGSSSSQWLAQESAYLVLNAIDIDYGNLERNQTQRMQKILGALDGFPCGIWCITLLWRWKSLNIFRPPQRAQNVPGLSAGPHQSHHLHLPPVTRQRVLRHAGPPWKRYDAICWRWLEMAGMSLFHTKPGSKYTFFGKVRKVHEVSIHFPIFFGA